ncbi:hypothetical protein ElyMa_004726300 [Elysia marginata]|uniref:Reverse transcriptase zinc-binding domain-containing protein n=1 Tax=Elysia marginata TaxID=1093978 RepID=A0AAV4IAJ0_9GAST|nr:hypothetical protein ElyMa_004726300 [Elysia marginata]
MAKEAAPLDKAEALISRRLKNTYLDYELKKESPPKKMENYPPDRRKEAGLSRKERVVVSKLRTSGNSCIFGYYRYEMVEINYPNCKDCPRELDDIKHVFLHCSKLRKEREKHLGPRPTLKLLQRNPQSCRLSEENYPIDI